MADPKSVPAGKYGRAALESLGVWQSVENRLAPAENVRLALALVSRGETPLGIVYKTDAAADPNVRIVGTFPANTHPPIVYPAALDRRRERRRRGLSDVSEVAGHPAHLGEAGLHRPQVVAGPGAHEADDRQPRIQHGMGGGPARRAGRRS